MSTVPDLIDDRHCFICGERNAAGLQLRLEVERGRSRTRVTLDERFQGYAGIAHGGIVAALLDEAVCYAAISLGRWAATAELAIRYLKPAPLAEALLLTAEVTRDRGRLVECEAVLATESGERLATARGKLIKGDPVDLEQVLRQRSTAPRP